MHFQRYCNRGNTLELLDIERRRKGAHATVFAAGSIPGFGAGQVPAFTSRSLGGGSGAAMSLPPPLDTRLAQAILAYRIGRALPIAMSAGPSGALFRDLAQDFIRAYLPEAEYRRFVAVRERCREIGRAHV